MSGEPKTVARNKRARHDYHIVDAIEAGIVLRGTEVKSVRLGKIVLGDGYARIENGEVFLHGTHISPYEYGNRSNVDPLRRRKLLLHKTEIRRLNRQVMEKGMTLVPLSAYIKNGVVKIEVGVCRGKKSYDKRETLAKRDAEREMERAIRRRGKGES